MANPYAGKVAVITGGASGIGRALAAELVDRGTRVVIADVDAEAAERVVEELGEGRSRALPLDVTDADAFRRVAEEVVTVEGAIDFLFNNAGIVVFGDVADMSLDDWNRQIDVNLRGVVHGVHAVYPIMIRQGQGHIVNTASAAGLLPAPAGTPYAATKHAVVGLSTSLRLEAVRYGVRVSALCPGFTDTPIKHRAKILVDANRDELLREFPFRLWPAEYCARAALRGVARNKAIIVVTPEAQLMWRVWRLSPALVMFLLRLGATRSPLLPKR